MGQSYIRFNTSALPGIASRLEIVRILMLLKEWTTNVPWLLSPQGVKSKRN